MSLLVIVVGLALAAPPAPSPPVAVAAPIATEIVTNLVADLVVDGAWIRQPPPGAKMLGGYLRVKNTGAAARKIVGVTTSLSLRAELHNHFNIDGVMKMRQVPVIEVPAGGEVVLQPGGLHIMVMQLKAAPKAGDVVDVTLQLEGGAVVVVKAPVQREAPAVALPAPIAPAPASPSGW